VDACLATATVQKDRELVVSPDNEPLLSAASACEIAIECALGKLKLPEAPEDYISILMIRTGITPLAVHHRHALRAESLSSHHRDPFDRLLVAQAQLETRRPSRRDRAFRPYDVEVLAA
jgi:PIN domain nuclease of toxin-antitoxin system